MRHCTYVLFLILATIAVGVAGCAGADRSDPIASPLASANASAAKETAAPRQVNTRFCQASGTAAVQDNGVLIDYSHTDQGYVMIRCSTGKGERLKVLISKEDTQLYYDLTNDGVFDSYSLTAGDGDYSATVYANIGADQYTPLLTVSFSVALESEFLPYLIPNHYVRYESGSSVLQVSRDLSQNARDDLAVVEAAYQYMVENIRYDYDKADKILSGEWTTYLPLPDRTLTEQEGICFDYSALFAALLRSQDIPTKLVMGYVQPLNVYHSWNEVYLTDVGWVRMQVYFDGTGWKLMDPTFAASGGLNEENTYDAIYRY